jgi:membrane protease YdiL (CAAX protease family)
VIVGTAGPASPRSWSAPRRWGTALVAAGFVPAALGAVWFAVVVLLAGFLLSTRRVSGIPLVVTSIAVTGGLLVAAFRSGLGAAHLGLSPAGQGVAALVSLGIAVVVASAVAAAGKVPRLLRLFEDSRRTGLTGREVARQALLDVPLGTVLVEEVAFRGVLLGLLLAQFGTGGAVAVSSLLFGLWHVPSALELHDASAIGSGDVHDRGRTVLATVAFTAAAGVVFAALRLLSGSLLPPAALHWATNASGIVVGWWLARRR